MEVLLNLLILVVVAVVVFLVAKYIMGEAELAGPIRQIVLLVLGLFFLIWLVNIFAGHPMWGPVVRMN
jgi:hypothetical protein